MKLRTWFFMLAFPLLVALLIAAALAPAIRWPTLVVNPTTLRMAARHLATLAIIVDWKEARVQAESHGAFDTTLAFGFEDLCVSWRPSVEKACFTKAEAAVRYRFRSIVPEIVSLGPLTLAGGDVAVRLEEKGHTGHRAALPALPRIALPSWLRGIALSPASIVIDAFEVRRGASSLTGSVAVQAATDEGGGLQSVDAQGSVEAAPRRIALEAGIESESRFARGDWKAHVSSEADLGPAGALSLTGDLASDDGETIRHALALTYVKGKIKSDAKLAGTLREGRIEASMSGSLKGAADAVPDASFSNCRFSLERKDAERNRGALSLDCQVAAGLKRLDLPGELSPFYHLPKSLRVHLSGSADTFFLPDLDQQTNGTLTARIEPVKDRLVKTDGEVRLAFSGVPSKPLREWKVQASPDVHFRISEFSRLVKRLASTRWPVPAPFNVLDGTLDFSLEGTISSTTGIARIPTKLTVLLTSKEQKIHAESQGELTFTAGAQGIRNASLDLDVRLADVQLRLPDVALAAIPRLTPDKRIRLGPAPAPEEAPGAKSLAWRVHAATDPEHPVRVLSNITPTFIPVALDVELANGETTGFVSITDFPVKIFRQKGKVDRVVLELKTPSKESAVSGAFSIPYAPYTITILLSGTFESPAVTLASEPPLSQGDIISVLVYGEPLNGLDATSASSVGSVNAALSDRALALTALFMLASTPVQNIAYNPQTKTFSMRIKLADKTSVIAGTGGGTQEVGVRQRIGKGWSITTTYGTSTDPTAITGATALIEWTKRY